MGYDGSLKFDTKIDESGFNKGIANLKNLAKTGTAVIGTMTAAGIAALSVMTKSALDSVGQLEQNIGGVETLFKKSADTVISNAQRAYESAGMSANDYMSTVTSFSASLLQSLGNDTAKAASYADRAIIDMSDNANKMGTSIELIQNAYQGFAKQNYTMLDNLKLGYGGTKTEMQRLIKNAAALTDIQKKLGIAVDDSSMSFGNIVNAISVMQESMGIAGTTAAEAATTIEGSMNSARAAWDNFLNGVGSAEEFSDAFSIAAENVIKNLGEIIPRLAATIPTVASSIFDLFVTEFEEKGDTLFQTGSQIVADMLTGMVESVPEIIDIVLSICSSLVSAIGNNAPQLLESGKELLQYFLDGITMNAPVIASAGANLLENLIGGIVDNIPIVLPRALEFIQSFADGIAEKAPGFIQKGFELLSMLVDGIVTAIPILIEKVPTIISTFANIINDNFPTILAKGAELLLQLIKGIINTIPTLVANIPQIISAIVDTIMAFQWLNLGKNIITFFKNGILGMLEAVKAAGTNVHNGIVNAIRNLPSTLQNLGKSAIYNLSDTIRGLASYAKTGALKVASAIESAILQVPSKMLSAGKNIVSGLWNGISGMTGWLAGKVRDFASGIVNNIKGALGIHSPSRVFRDQVGKMMALGVGVGFEKNLPIQTMNEGLKNAVQKVKKDAILTMSVQQGKTVGSIKKNPSIYPENNSTNLDEWERRQRKLNKERDSRPIFLGTERIDKPLPKGAVPAL